MALVVEAGEFVEHFQWLTETESANLTGEKRESVTHELADVFIYLLRLADVLDVDLLEAAQRKLQVNIRKYPIEKVKGRAANYDEL